MKFDYEEFATAEEVLVYLVTIAPLMKQVLTINSYKGYTFAMIPVSPLSGDHILMVYTKAPMELGLIEFDISTQKYRKVATAERTDKNYFIIIRPKRNTLADQAIKELEGK